jgi:hypothetical protein
VIIPVIQNRCMKICSYVLKNNLKCQNRGCGFFSLLDDHKKHRMICDCLLISCKYARCRYHSLLKADVISHEIECERRPLICSHWSQIMSHHELKCNHPQYRCFQWYKNDGKYIKRYICNIMGCKSEDYILQKLIGWSRLSNNESSSMVYLR